MALRAAKPGAEEFGQVAENLSSSRVRELIPDPVRPD
jgi:hypothetical protein